MSKVYIGYIVEPIYKDGKITLELRVRVPTIHGISSRSGIKDEDLPIAKPMFMPGIIYNQHLFLEAINNINKVYIIFEGGDTTEPVYLGIKGNSNLYDIPVNDYEKYAEASGTLTLEGSSSGSPS